MTTQITPESAIHTLATADAYGEHVDDAANALASAMLAVRKFDIDDDASMLLGEWLLAIDVQEDDTIDSLLARWSAAQDFRARYDSREQPLIDGRAMLDVADDVDVTRASAKSSTLALDLQRDGRLLRSDPFITIGMADFLTHDDPGATERNYPTNRTAHADPGDLDALAARQRDEQRQDAPLHVEDDPSWTTRDDIDQECAADRAAEQSRSILAGE